MRCPYCNNKAILVTGKIIYPHRPDLADRTFWLCGPCDAYVGTHKNSNNKPLGRLANAELRKAKQKVHNHFDPLWKSGRMSRSKAYEWLAKELGISKSKCHIGMFDIMMCERAINCCRDKS